MFAKLMLLFSILFGGYDLGRVGAVRGEAQIRRYYDDSFEYLTINNVVGEGDEIVTSGDSRVEIEFSDGTVLTLGERTHIIFDRVEEDRVELYIESGKVRVFTRERDFLIDSDFGSTEVERRSRVRVDVRNSRQYVRVISGKAFFEDYEIYAGEELVVKESGRIYVRKYRDYDSFDYWARDFEERYVVIYREEYIPVPVVFGIYELREYGRWRYVPPYGWVWVPRVRYGWRPYHEGHWIYRPGIGWIWVPYEPWGWIPYHYGRWAFVVEIGWVWVPGDVWAGAWVEWSYGPGWIAWVPLDPWDRPIYEIHIHYHTINVWNCVDYEDFKRPIYRYKPPKNGVYRAPYKPVKSVKVEHIKKYATRKLPVKPPEIKYTKPVIKTVERKTRVKINTEERKRLNIPRRDTKKRILLEEREKESVKRDHEKKIPVKKDEKAPDYRIKRDREKELILDRKYKSRDNVNIIRKKTKTDNKKIKKKKGEEEKKVKGGVIR